MAPISGHSFGAKLLGICAELSLEGTTSSQARSLLTEVLQVGAEPSGLTSSAATTDSLEGTGLGLSFPGITSFSHSLQK